MPESGVSLATYLYSRAFNGGFDLASEWMGWENVAHCEINEFCLKILNYYWPNAKTHRDIKTTDFSIYRGQIDIVTGGFPCQPFSVAGEQKGTEDERHLWPEMLRAIREIQPRWIVGENVLGLVNWNGGMVFEQVQADLEAAGYEVFAYVLPACGIDAPHERYRTWFVAHCNSQGLQERLSAEQPGIYKEDYSYKGSVPERIFPKTDWQQFPTQSPVFNRNDGVSDKLDGITISEWRTESIKGVGNAIVPQAAHQIFKAIEQYESGL